MGERGGDFLSAFVPGLATVGAIFGSAALGGGLAGRNVNSFSLDKRTYYQGSDGVYRSGVSGPDISPNSVERPGELSSVTPKETDPFGGISSPEAPATLDKASFSVRTQGIASAGSGSVGQPGFWESAIPVWGSGRAAYDDFQNGNYLSGAFNTAMAISDAFLVKALVVGVGKLAAKTAFKSGSHSWKMTKNWLKKTGQVKKGIDTHHWLLHQNQGLGKYVSKAVKNQPWNLKHIKGIGGHSSRTTHLAIHGRSRQLSLNWAQRAYYGTPSWVGNLGFYGTGRTFNASKNFYNGTY